VVRELEVKQVVTQHIVHQIGRQLEHIGVEGERAVGRARSPLGSHRPNLDTAHLHAQALGPHVHANAQLAPWLSDAPDQPPAAQARLAYPATLSRAGGQRPEGNQFHPARAFSLHAINPSVRPSSIAIIRPT